VQHAPRFAAIVGAKKPADVGGHVHSLCVRWRKEDLLQVASAPDRRRFPWPIRRIAMRCVGACRKTPDYRAAQHAQKRC
jgi:hypothetical protein